MSRLAEKLRWQAVSVPKPAIKPPKKNRLIAQAVQLFWRVMVQRRVLVLVERPSGGVGDLLCLLASVPRLRIKHPRVWLVLAADHPHLDFARCTQTVDQLLAFRSFPHRIAVRWVRPENRRTAVLPDEATPPRPRARVPLTVEFARILKVTEVGELPQLAVPREAANYVEKHLHNAGWRPVYPLIIVHTGPTWKVKEWPEARWRELRSRLDGVTATWVQVGHHGPNGIAPFRIPNCQDWVGQLDLRELAALIAKATVFIGIDSGPMHIAAALRVPIVALFGPTDSSCFLPARPNVIGLHADLPCIGCHHSPEGPRHWRDSCPFNIRCMHDLSPERVAEAVGQVLLTSSATATSHSSL